ncbi:MAG: hypothetical protein FJW30_02100 [Acidobacteria bacterium]|nr:hypothetical protein [Acidobacteriota bacterium]
MASGPETPQAEPVTPTPPQGWRKYVRITAGIGLLIVGIIGLLLPVMPQWPFIIPGLALLGDYFPPARRLNAWIQTKIKDAREYVQRKKNGAG